MKKMALIIVAIIISLLVGCAPSTAPKQQSSTRDFRPPTVDQIIDKAKFTAWVAETVKIFDANISVKTTSPLELELSRVNASEKHASKFFLDRFYRSCNAQGRQECYKLILAYLPAIRAQAFESTGINVLSKKSLVAVIRTKDYLDEAEKMSGDSNSDDEIVATPFVGPLWIIYAYDTPTSTGFLKRGQLRKLNIKQDDLLPIAQENLRKLLQPMGNFKVKLGVHQLQTIYYGNVYESSRLLLTEQWADLANLQNAPLLVSIPARDLIVYTTAIDPEAVMAMTVFNYKAAQRADFPISPVVLRWTPTGWVEEYLDKRGR